MIQDYEQREFITTDLEFTLLNLNLNNEQLKYYEKQAFEHLKDYLRYDESKEYMKAYDIWQQYKKIMLNRGLK